MSVSSTSVKRRSTIHSRIAIESKAQMPASMKARTTVLPDSRIEIGPPLAVGSTASTARAKLPQRLVVVGIALGVNLDAGAAIGREPVARLISGGMFSAVICCGLQRIAQAVERGLAAARRTRIRRARAAPGRHWRAVVSAAASRLAASAPGPVCVPAWRVQGVGAAVERGDVLRIGRGWPRRRFERRLERFARPGLISASFCVLIGRDEACRAS